MNQRETVAIGQTREKSRIEFPIDSYMQKTKTLEFGLVLEGEIVPVLDTQEAPLRQGDTVVQRGTNHAWSNRSDRPAVVAIAPHDAR